MRHYLWCLALLGIVGFFYYQNKSTEVFPSASIDIRLSKKEISDLAHNWAAKLNYKEVKPIESTVFAYDDDAKTFLEYELGASEANGLMKETIPIWYWSTRLCQQLKQEQFTVWTRPDGQLISFEHEIENDRALPSFSHDVAKRRAEDFVNKEAKFSLDGYKLIEDASTVQAHRTDHYFTWEDTRVSYHQAKLRTHVYISGQTITAFNHFLYVPEEWTRKFAKLRSYNDALADFASIFYVALQTGSFFLFVWAFASGLIRWRLCLTVAILYTVFFVVESLNDYAVTLHDYSSTMPFAGFQLEFLGGTLYAGLGTFVQTFVLMASGEALYRRFFPGKNCYRTHLLGSRLARQEYTAWIDRRHIDVRHSSGLDRCLLSLRQTARIMVPAGGAKCRIVEFHSTSHFCLACWIHGLFKRRVSLPHHRINRLPAPGAELLGSKSLAGGSLGFHAQQLSARASFCQRSGVDLRRLLLRNNYEILWHPALCFLS